MSIQPRSFDILPDGRLIGVIDPEAAGGGDPRIEFRVVLNWSEELRQRVPVK